MTKREEYRIHQDIRYGPLTRMDVPALVAGCTERWFNQTLCTVNDSVVRLGIVEGEFHWHRHDEEDELFFVLSGLLLLDLEDRTVELGPHQGFVVPRSVNHRTRAEAPTVMLMVEKRGVDPEGDEE